MDIASLLIQLISGAVGGNAAGSMLKQFSLGTAGNSILGIIGGGVGGQLLHLLMSSGTGATAAAATSGMDIGSILSNVAGGGIGGGILMIIVGLIKSKMAPAR
jgi:hypothetical protein